MVRGCFDLSEAPMNECWERARTGRIMTNFKILKSSPFKVLVAQQAKCEARAINYYLQQANTLWPPAGVLNNLNDSLILGHQQSCKLVCICAADGGRAGQGDNTPHHRGRARKRARLPAGEPLVKARCIYNGCLHSTICSVAFDLGVAVGTRTISKPSKVENSNYCI